MTDSYRSIVLRALEAAAGINSVGVEEIFTEDVHGWSPNLNVSSRAELEKEFEERIDALSNVTVTISGFNVVGSKAMAEWRLTADHLGPITFGDEYVVEPTGRHLILAGATFAEFRGNQISDFRNYFDDAALLEQLLVAD